MILSFTKEVAKLFNMTDKLKISHAEKFKNSAPLDDWVLDVMFSSKNVTGVFLVHRHSLLTLFVISDKIDLTYCLNLLFGQLRKLMENIGCNTIKHQKFIDALTFELITVRHNNPAVSNEIGTIKFHFDWFNEQTLAEHKKFNSYEFMTLLNSKPKAKYGFKKPIVIFTQLLMQHIDDPVLITNNHPDYSKPITLH